MIKTEKYCHRAEDIPVGDHWAILDFRSISVPGYDPGDPISSERIHDYISFLNEEEWKKEIHLRMTSEYGKKEFSALIVKRP